MAFVLMTLFTVHPFIDCAQTNVDSTEARRKCEPQPNWITKDPWNYNRVSFTSLAPFFLGFTLRSHLNWLLQVYAVAFVVCTHTKRKKETGNCIFMIVLAAVATTPHGHRSTTLSLYCTIIQCLRFFIWEIESINKLPQSTIYHRIHLQAGQKDTEIKTRKKHLEFTINYLESAECVRVCVSMQNHRPWVM